MRQMIACSEENLLDPYFIEDLRMYLSVMHTRFYSKPLVRLSSDTFEVEVDERQRYLRYLFWILPEHAGWYESPKRSGYRLFCVNAVWHMQDFVNMGYPVTGRLYQQLSSLSPDYSRSNPILVAHKIMLGKNVFDITYGLQKFIWSFLVWHSKNRGFDITR